MARSSDPELLAKLNEQTDILGTSSAQASSDIQDLKDKVASLSADLSLLKLSTASAAFDDLSTEKIATLSGLLVTGKTNLNDLGVAGKITSGLITIDGLEGSIDSLDILKIQPSAAADIEFLSGAIVFDKDGNLNIKEGRIIANDNVRGIDVAVAPGQTEVDISFVNPRPTPGYAVSVNSSWITSVAVTEKRKDGFTVKLSTPSVTGGTIDWIAVD